MKLRFRDDIHADDRDMVLKITDQTGFFNPEEVLIALELVDERLEKGEESGYHFHICEDEGGSVLGYTCYGPVPGTQTSFDLYWIVVRKDRQGQGIGRLLLEHTENAITGMGGEQVYIETSSRDLYKPTQAFYQKSGYCQEAFLKDFYAPGDSKIIYVKKLG